MRPLGSRLLIAAVAIAALAGCDRAGPADATGNETVRADVPAPAPVEASRLVGRWSESPDCSSSFEFRADRTFTVAGGGEGRWTLAGEVLTVSGDERSARVRLRRLDAGVMIAEDEQGRTSRSIRC